MAFPNHRYLLNHEPRRREVIERWWCGGSEQPNEARISVELQQPNARSAEPLYVSRLVALSVNGTKPSARLLHEVRSKIDGLGQVLRINTRCQDTPSHGVVGVLNVSYWNSYEQRMTFELRP